MYRSTQLAPERCPRHRVTARQQRLQRLDVDTDPTGRARPPAARPHARHLTRRRRQVLRVVRRRRRRRRRVQGRHPQHDRAPPIHGHLSVNHGVRPDRVHSRVTASVPLEQDELSLTGSTLDGVRCRSCLRDRGSCNRQCDRPVSGLGRDRDADVGSANAEVSGPPCQRSKTARGTRSCLPIRITGNPAPPSVRMNWRASSYAAVRPIRNTAAASSTVKKSGNGPPDTTRLELDVTPTLPPSGMRVSLRSHSPPRSVTTEREPAACHLDSPQRPGPVAASDESTCLANCRRSRLSPRRETADLGMIIGEAVVGSPQAERHHSTPTASARLELLLRCEQRGRRHAPARGRSRRPSRCSASGDRGVVAGPERDLRHRVAHLLAVGLHELAQVWKSRCAEAGPVAETLEVLRHASTASTGPTRRRRPRTRRRRRPGRRRTSSRGARACRSGRVRIATVRLVERDRADAPVLRRDLLAPATSAGDDARRHRQQPALARSRSRRRRSPHSSARRRPVVAATRIARAYSGASGLLGRVDQRTHLLRRRHDRRRVRDRRRLGPLRRVRLAPAPSARLREHRREAGVDLVHAARRQATVLVGTVEVGERLRRHLRHRPSGRASGWMLRA